MITQSDASTTVPLRRRGGWRLLAAVSALVLGLVSGCSGDADPTSGSGDADRASAGGQQNGGQQNGAGGDGGGSAGARLEPLTGKDADGDPSKRPVLAVKIDNTAAAAPQVGLRSADLVVEELVEGGSTRLAAMFHSELPSVVGPVRSLRASDIGIVQPARATVVASGGAKRTIRRLVAAKVTTTKDGDPGYTRAGDRASPYNLMVRLRELADSLPRPDAEPPEPYLPFGKAYMRGGKRARAFEVAFTQGNATFWRFDNSTYERTGRLADRGDRFAADSVLVLRVRVKSAGYKDPAGNPVPETILDGKGDAQLFHDGAVVDARWRKDGLAAPIELADAGGDDLAVAPGRTWVALVPADGGSVRVAR